ncbi:SPOR domain-containing protein [Nitrosomonas sp.]|uniref:SPOR domain-containing protein n=1 Tax=Nitrosomonas sp. TaxID=42353 RepID=UPI0025F0A090|nr:SPOR domain-containing protein [Nitrosomonas sp.]
MVKNVSEEEILLRKRARRRLIGAITFVILSVVFLPMILDDAPQQEEQQIDIQIPSEELTAEAYPWMTPENAPIAEEMEIPRGTEKPLPFSDSEHAERNENSASDKSRIGAVPTPAKKPSYVKPTPTVTSTPVVQEKISVSQEKAPVSNNIKAQEGAFIIQLGAFSDITKAKQQQQNLVANGIRAYTETIKVGNGEMTRVRIGPFATREAAEAEHERLKKTGLSGVVTAK